MKVLEKEISERPGWHDIPKDGGGDIDLAEYSLKPSYDALKSYEQLNNGIKQNE